jgi:hypothetical protein
MAKLRGQTTARNASRGSSEDKEGTPYAKAIATRLGEYGKSRACGTIFSMLVSRLSCDAIFERTSQFDPDTAVGVDTNLKIKAVYG